MDRTWGRDPGWCASLDEETQVQVIALQLVSPDVSDVIGALAQREQGEREERTGGTRQEPPRVQYVGGKPSPGVAEEVARRIAEDRKAGKVGGVKGTPEGRAWFFGNG